MQRARNSTAARALDLDSLESRPLAGTEGALAPFFSPDSRWIGFFAEGKLKKIPVSGGEFSDRVRFGWFMGWELGT